MTRDPDWLPVDCPVCGAVEAITADSWPGDCPECGADYTTQHRVANGHADPDHVGGD